jgi:hypothetical protein
MSAMDETLRPVGTLGRKTKGEVALVDRLRAAFDCWTLLKTSRSCPSTEATPSVSSVGAPGSEY